MSERVAQKGDRPLVTLALFAYNQESFIRDAVESVLAQDYPHLEIILSDDASTDETYAVMRKLADNYHGPHQIRLNRNSVNTGAGGLGAHVNQVMALANGELIVCAAGDDVPHTQRVSKLARLWDESGRTSGSFHSAVQVVSQDGQPRQISHGQASFVGYSTADLVRMGGKGVLGASHAFTRDLFTHFGPLDSHAVFEDRILMFRAHLIGSITYTPEVLVDYRIHGSNLSGRANYQDPVRWQRWIDGAINVLDHFERDHLRVNGGRLAPAVASALRSERRRLEGARDIHEPRRVMRVLAAWRFAGDQSLRQRIGFVIECAGWMDAPILKWIRLLKRTHSGYPHSSDC